MQVFTATFDRSPALSAGLFHVGLELKRVTHDDSNTLFHAFFLGVIRMSSMRIFCRTNKIASPAPRHFWSWTAAA